MVPEGWEIKPLKSVTKIYDGTHQTPKYVEVGVPFYSVEHITGDQFGQTKYISEDVFDKECQRVTLERNDILMTRIGDIGTAKEIDWDVRASFYVSLALIKKNRAFNSTYLENYINSRQFRSELWRRTIHVAFPKKINLGEIGNCEVLLPPLPEQKKIAQILSTWDQAISATERLLENSQQRKKGLMQQLLTGKKRLPGFEGEWENSILTEHCSVTTGNKDLQNKVENGEYPFFVRSSNIERIDSYSFDGEAILIPGDGRVGEIFHYIDGKFDFHQRVYKLSDFEGALGLFIYYYLKRFFKAEVIKNSVKATVDSLRMPVFTGMRIKLPSLEEQRQIVDVLSCSDKEIQAITQRLYLLKQEKKALMQQLLTGKRRVNVETEAV